MNANRERLASILIGITIIAYGVSSSNVLPFYQQIVEGIVPSESLEDLKAFFGGRRFDKQDQYNLGKYLVYYPSYLVLHLGLISVLFRKSPKSRKLGFFAVAFGIPFLALLSLLFYRLKWMGVYDATIDTFTTFVGYPFILFVVEGGKMLGQDIDKLIEDHDKKA